MTDKIIEHFKNNEKGLALLASVLIVLLVFIFIIWAIVKMIRGILGN